MGVVNVTPDSFSDGGAFDDADDAVAHGRRLAAEGAEILDVGGESTRPGASPVPADEELHRVVPVVERLAVGGVARVSVDTTKVAVAEAALQAGARIVNDVSGFRFEPEMAGLEEPADRVPGTIATNVIAYERGASIFRVHDVAPVVDALKVAAATVTSAW